MSGRAKPRITSGDRRIPSSSLCKTGNVNNIINDTKAANEPEHDMTFLWGVRLYIKTMAGSLLFLTIAMEGYDTALMNRTVSTIFPNCANPQLPSVQI